MGDRIEPWDVVGWAGKAWRVCWRTCGLLSISDGSCGRLVSADMVTLIRKGEGMDLEREFRDPYPEE